MDVEERRAYIQKNLELLKQTNGESILQLSSATLEVWKIAVMKYPNMDSAMKSRIIWTRRNQRYVETKTYFGCEADAWKEIGKALGLEE